MLIQLTTSCFLIILCASLLALALPGNLREQLPKFNEDETSKFIVGGRKASEGQFPYLVSLRMAFGHLCGGSLLNTRWVLSAAHCTVFIEIQEIVAGSVKLSEGGDRYGVERIVNHPNYDLNKNPFLDDICMLKTNRTVEFNQFVQPIPLNRDQVRWRNMAVIAGWGHTVGGDHVNENVNLVVSEDLNFIEVNVLSHLECLWRIAPLTFFIRTDHICTFKRNAGVCIFDSGSSVVADGKLIGVVSFNIPCALNFPDWGPRVSSYINWIDSVMTTSDDFDG